MATQALTKSTERRGRYGLAPIEEEMRQLFSRFFGEGQELSWPTGGLGSLDLSETDKQVEVRLDLPGVDAKDIDIQIRDKILVVSGERKEEKEEKDKTHHRIERRYGSFSRSVTLPTAVNEDAVDAQYRDGVLTIKMPKIEESKARKIKINA